MIERKIEIEAPIERVFSIICDFESYPEFVPYTESVNLRKSSDQNWEADFVLRLIKEVRYSLRFEIEKPRSIKWTLIKGSFMKKNSGSWALKEKSSNSTEAIYRIDVDFGFFVPKKIVEGLTSVQLPEMMRAFKERAEKGKAINQS